MKQNQTYYFDIYDLTGMHDPVSLEYVIGCIFKNNLISQKSIDKLKRCCVGHFVIVGGIKFKRVRKPSK